MQVVRYNILFFSMSERELNNNKIYFHQDTFDTIMIIDIYLVHVRKSICGFLGNLTTRINEDQVSSTYIITGHVLTLDS